MIRKVRSTTWPWPGDPFVTLTIDEPAIIHKCSRCRTSTSLVIDLFLILSKSFRSKHNRNTKTKWKYKTTSILLIFRDEVLLVYLVSRGAWTFLSCHNSHNSAASKVFRFIKPIGTRNNRSVFFQKGGQI